MCVPRARHAAPGSAAARPCPSLLPCPPQQRREVHRLTAWEAPSELWPHAFITLCVPAVHAVAMEDRVSVWPAIVQKVGPAGEAKGGAGRGVRRRPQCLQAK